MRLSKDLMLGVSAVLCAGCATISGQTSGGNGSAVYVASAYSLTGCQEKLDEEAGHHVLLTEHAQNVLGSVLNFGLTPAYM
jgi:hypothetical protein